MKYRYATGIYTKVSQQQNEMKHNQQSLRFVTNSLIYSRMQCSSPKFQGLATTISFYCNNINLSA